jgi:hypothetical protein
LNWRDREDTLHSRRSALKTICGGFLAASGLNYLGGTNVLAKQEALAREIPYKIMGWTGDDFTLGHRLRDKKFDAAPRKVEKTVDFVIVGGGISGLSLAHFLQDHDFLLLEQYGDLGGQARGDLTEKIGFSYGSTWINSLEGELGQLLEAVGLKPTKLESISTAWLWNEHWKSLTNEATLAKNFANLLESCRSQLKQVGKSLAFSSTGNSALVELDKLAFDKVADIQAGQFQNLIDNYFRSVACCNTKTASALAGLKLLQSLTNQRFSLCGGNAALVKVLKAAISVKHPCALLNKVFVWAIEPQDAGVLVTYSDAHGEYHTVSAKHVAITAPPMVASRLITNMNNIARIPLLKLRYGSYLVGNIQLSSPIFDFGYQGYSSNLSGLAEIDVAEAACGGRPLSHPPHGSRLTLKQPFEPGSEGRTLLLEGNQDSLSQLLIDQLQTCAPGQRLDVESITLSRWGHAIAAPLPGYYAVVSKIAADQLPSVSLSHCSTAGIASLEAAVEAARQTANRALGKPAKKSISFSI